MRLLLPVIGSDQALLLDALGGRCGGTPDRAGAQAADMMSAFVGGLPLPRRLRDVGVAETALPEIAHLTMSDYMMANLPRPLSEHEVLALLRSVW
jgi:alcohol dehydrogenase class IV